MAENPTPSNPQRDWKDYLTPRRIVAGVIVIVALLAILQNTTTGEFNFLFFEFSAPRWLWVLGVFAGGFATGWLVKGRRSDHVA